MEDPIQSSSDPDLPENVAPDPKTPELTFEESRVLGCLIEKARTTPEYYPLTLNALMAACNQKSNRDPVTAFDTATVTHAVESLGYKHFGATIHEAGARVPKYKHTMERHFPYLEHQHFALLSVLMLRGPQTIGELRQRTERMAHFPDLESAQAALDDLIRFEPHPLVRCLPAGGGRRAMTFVHLLCGEPADTPALEGASAGSVDSQDPPNWRGEIETAIESLRTEIAQLRDEIAQLKGM